jgi:farnesyl diphosphate synthase
MNELLKEAITETEKKVDEVISRLIPRVQAPENQLYDAMRYGTLEGGKRLRPLLVIKSAEIFKVDETCTLMVAAAIECMHSYSLIHDDLPAMDDAKLRRGRPSLHMEYDEATAILAGDALQALAFEIMTHDSTHSDPRVRLRLVEGLAKAAGPRGMCGGQMLDMIGEKEEFDLGTITRLQRMKTGAMITFACETGAILGKATPMQQMALRNYANDLGLAFQIIDDLLDHEGVKQDLGKETGKDQKANKSTFVKAMGAKETRQKAEMLIEQAKKHLDVFEKHRSAVLYELADYMLTRKR